MSGRARATVAAWSAMDRRPRRRTRAAVWAVGFSSAWLVARAAMPSGLPPGVVLQGAVLGGLSSLAAMGLVLLYRAVRVVNFAQVAVGGLGASLAVALAEGPHWPYGACVACGIGLSMVAGGMTEALLHWRFDRAPRLVVMVVTIGLLQVFAATQLAIPGLVGSPSSVNTPLQFPLSIDFMLDPLTFTGSDVAALVAVPVLALALWWFLWRTDTGRVVRGAADARDHALLLGLPLRQSARSVWVVAAGLSAVGAVLSVPILQVVPATASSPVDLLAPLAAAVLARFTSLPAAVGWSVVIGVVQQSVFWSFHTATYADVTVFVLIAVGLGLQRRAAGRDDLGTRFGDWAAVNDVRRIPRRLAALPEVRLTRSLGLAVVAAAAVTLPFWLSAAQSGPMAVAAIYAVIAVSLVVLTGWSGQVSLGQFAFAGMGALSTGALLTHAHADLFVSLGVSAVAGALAAVLIGLPAMRLSGVQLTVITLAFAVVVSEWLLSPQYFPSLNPLELGRPTLFGKLPLSSPVTFYELCLGALLVTLLLARNLRRSRAGRALLAVRDSPEDAAAFGVVPWRERLSAFAFAGALAGMAGGLYVVAVGGTGFGGIDPTLSVTVFSMAVVGGLGSLTGALLGAAYIWSVVTFLPAGWSLLASGAGLVLLLAFVPEGLAGVLFGLRDAGLRRLAARRGIETTWGHPSGPATAEPAEPTEPAAPAATPEPATGRVVALLAVRGLDVAFASQRALRGASIEVGAGQAVALVGTNGAGKSTLLRAVAGLVRPQNGTVAWDGEDIAGWDTGRRVAAGIVTVLGGRGIFPSLTVEENLRLAGWTLRRRHRHPAALAEAEAEVDALFPVLGRRRRVPAGQLSGGERQMLALGQALLCRPRLLLIDELSLGLAPTVVAALASALRTLRDRGVSMVLVDQSVRVAATVCPTAVFLERGRVRFCGPVDELAGRDDLLRPVFLGDSDRRDAGVETADQTPDTPEMTAPHLTVPAPATAPALATAVVSKRFGGVAALTEVSLGVGEGEIVGLIGPNGAGKTTLFDVCSGVERPEHGTVDLLGEDVTRWPPARRAMLGLGRMFQDTWLFPSMTVEEVVAVARDRHLAVRDALLGILWTHHAAASERRGAAEVASLLGQLSLSEVAQVPISALSTGVRRLVALACALAFEPRVLLLDEPSSGLAESEARRLVPLLHDLRRRTGASFVVIDHDLPLVRSLADRLAYLDAGTLRRQGPTDQVLTDPEVLAAFVGAGAK